jgi:hypothetical protein
MCEELVLVSHLKTHTVFVFLSPPKTSLEIPLKGILFDCFLQLIFHISPVELIVFGSLSFLYVCTAKTQYQKFETNIPRKGIARPQSQFPHSCVCERFIYPTIDLPILLQVNIWSDPKKI